MQTALHSPAAERNQHAILEVLRGLLPPQGRALEIASGTGQHGPFFMSGLPGWSWQPSDLTPERVASAAAWAAQASAEVQARILPGLLLDVLARPWPLEAQRYELIFCANMLHAAPWACCAGLMQGAARHLSEQGQLITYGPYFEDEVATAPSNLDFDADLRGRGLGWGLRRLAEVRAEAEAAGLQLRQRVPMPSNNLLLVWTRPPAA